MEKIQNIELENLTKEEAILCEGGSAALALAGFGAVCIGLYYLGYAAYKVTH
jgi:hypothetical protein